MLAGRAGIDDVDARTLHEIAWMVEGVERAEHARMTRLEAYMRSMLGKKPLRPGKLDPYCARMVSRTTKGTRFHFVMDGVGVSKEEFAMRLEMDKARDARRK